MTDNLPEIQSHEAAQACATTYDPIANWMDSARFDQVQRVAKVFAESNAVPEHYRGKLADCIIGIQMAFALGLPHPLQFFQNSYVVAGKPGMEAKFVIAMINTRGPFDGPVDWRFSGERETDSWTCTAFAQHKKTGRVCETSVDWKMVKAEGWLAKNGSKWKTMPEMMFRYRSAAFLARLYCPEVLMGLSTVDELHDISDQITSVTPVRELLTITANSAPANQEPPKRRGRPPQSEKQAEPVTIPEQPVIAPEQPALVLPAALAIKDALKLKLETNVKFVELPVDLQEELTRCGFSGDGYVLWADDTTDARAAAAAFESDEDYKKMFVDLEVRSK